MFVLTKVWHKEKYRDAFIKGHLHLSCMTDYHKIVSERNLYMLACQEDEEAAESVKFLHSDQIDPFEGTIGCIDIGEEIIEDEKLGKLIADPRIRALGYDYSNIMCFSKKDYSFISHVDRPGEEGHILLEWQETKMDDFGSYGVIIKDMRKFSSIIMKVLDERKCHYLFGNGYYHPLKFRGKRLTEAMMITHLQRREPVLENEFALKTRRYDAFDKWDRHSYENEWRLIVNQFPEGNVNNKIQSEAMELDVGDLSDIAIPVESSELVAYMDQLFESGEIASSIDMSIGHISRRDMREEFYRLGNGMAYEIISLGKYARYEG